MTQLNPVAKLSDDGLPIGRGRCVTEKVEVIDVRGEVLEVANSDRKEGQRSRMRVGERARERCLSSVLN